MTSSKSSPGNGLQGSCVISSHVAALRGPTQPWQELHDDKERATVVVSACDVIGVVYSPCSDPSRSTAISSELYRPLRAVNRSHDTHSLLHREVVPCPQHIRPIRRPKDLLRCPVPLRVVDAINPIFHFHHHASVLLRHSGARGVVEEALGGLEREGACIRVSLYDADSDIDVEGVPFILLQE